MLHTYLNRALLLVALRMRHTIAWQCVGISCEEYLELQSSNESWCCRKCLHKALPFFDTSNSRLCFLFFVPRLCSVCVKWDLIKPFFIGLTILAFCRSLSPVIDDLCLLAAAQTPDIIIIIMWDLAWWFYC